jgi:hypothetical protein
MPYRKRTAEYRSLPASLAQQHNIPDGAFHATLLSVGSGQLRIQTRPVQRKPASISLTPCFTCGILYLRSRFSLVRTPERSCVNVETVESKPSIPNS